MPKKYILHKKSPRSQKTEVIHQRMEFRLGPLIVCALLAVAFWLYIVATYDDPREPTGSETTAQADTVVSTEPAAKKGPSA